VSDVSPGGNLEDRPEDAAGARPDDRPGDPSTDDPGTDPSGSGSSGFERGTDGPKVILAGVDGSDTSWRAAAYAAGLARRQGSLLALVYVQPTLAAAAALGAPVAGTTEEVAQELVAEIRRTAEQLRGMFDVRWEFHTLHGDAYAGLVQAAQDLTADAVVVGASEQAGHRFVGSVAVRLVKAGRWPVTVVP
jgi:nucleotide-binding universal stress UspA family protein